MKPLVGREAVDVARITGLPWYYAQVHTHGLCVPVLDVSSLDGWTRFTINWALVAGYAWLATAGYLVSTLAAERDITYGGSRDR
jgi:hypothetical protein